MTRNLIRLAALAFVLATTIGLTLPLPALAATCGSGNFFVNCSKKCCRTGSTTITLAATGFGSNCTNAKNTCGSCLASCPSGYTLCGGPSYGTCGF